MNNEDQSSPKEKNVSKSVNPFGETEKIPVQKDETPLLGGTTQKLDGPSAFDLTDDKPSFDDIINDDSNDFMKNSEDDSDPVDEVVRKKRWKFITGLILILLVVFAAVFTAVLFALNSPMFRGSTQTVVAPSISKSTSSNSKTISDFQENKFLKLFPSAPIVETRSVNVTAGGNTFTSTTNHNLSINNGTVTGTTEICTVNEPTDFCYTGVANSNIHVYFFNDLVHSKILSNASNFKKQDVTGAPAAASFNISLSSNSPVSAIGVVANDSSGYILTLPTSATTSDISTLISNLSIS